MGLVPRPRPPFLHKETSRHGRVVWYVRRGKGPRIRLTAAWDTPEFHAQYEAALAGDPVENVGKAIGGSLEWLIARYRDSTAWTALSLATRRQRECILRQIIASAGRDPIGAVTTRAIKKGIDRRKGTPAQARHFLDTMRGLFRWAVDAELAPTDPTIGVMAPKKTGDGHHTWTIEERAAFEARWQIGTRERLAYAVLLYTGLRRGDAVTFGRPHVRDGVATIRTEKTAEVVTFRIPPQLATAIEAGPCGELTYIAGERGRPMTKEAFGNWFRRACQAAGVPGTAHGLRKALATDYAERGASEWELDARFGWRGGKTSAVYTRKANRKALALRADERLENRYSRTSLEGAGAKPKISTKTTP